jgi:perosamine synthetase
MIPVCRPYLTGKEKNYVLEALDSGWISSAGKYLKYFEENFSKYCETKQGVCCTNGTAAVHMALYAIGVKPGDRIVVPSFTMMASIFPIIQMNAIPVFVDCEKDSWTLKVSELEKIEGPVKAVMPVHIYGQACDMKPINEWAKKRGALVIEDAAEAHGATYHNKKIGSLGDIATFSFYANKIITSGEGGIVVSDNAEYIQRARYFHNLCFDKNPDLRFIHKDIGYNFRLTNLQAAILCAQLEDIDKLVEMRREMAKKYLERLQNYSKIILPTEKENTKNVYWMFGVLLSDEVTLSVEEVRKRLLEKGIDTRRFFYPGHRQPALSGLMETLPCPTSEYLWERGFYLPSSSDLTHEEADIVVNTLKSTLS